MAKKVKTVSYKCPLPRNTLFRTSRKEGEKYLDADGNFSVFSDKTWLYDNPEDSCIDDIYNWGCLEDYARMVQVKVTTEVCLVK